jgi:putative acetyltransferase
MEKLGHSIRKVTTEDHAPIAALLEAAFERPDEARLVVKLWSKHAIKFERLAEVSGEVIGYCAFTPVTCQPPLDGLLVGLGPLAVAPTHQRQGIGAELVEEGLAVCRENKARLIAVLVDPDYCARFGFEPASAKMMNWAGFDAGDAFRILDNGDFDTDEIRVIHYHPAFDALS